MKDSGADVAEEHGIRRSPKWPHVQRAFLEAKPWCEVCGPHKKLERGIQVHHVIPFHFCILLGRPELELDPRNLVGLCETEEGLPLPNHHLLVGHLDDFQTSNPHVRQDATGRFFMKTDDQIKADAVWQAMVKHRPPTWGSMTDDDKKAMRALMDQLYPAQPKVG